MTDLRFLLELQDEVKKYTKIYGYDKAKSFNIMNKFLKVLANYSTETDPNNCHLCITLMEDLKALQRNKKLWNKVKKYNYKSISLTAVLYHMIKNYD